MQLLFITTFMVLFYLCEALCDFALGKVLYWINFTYLITYWKGRENTQLMEKCNVPKRLFYLFWRTEADCYFFIYKYVTMDGRILIMLLLLLSRFLLVIIIKG